MNNSNINASANISASVFFSELMTISSDIIWKNQALANSYETKDDYINVEMFIAANKGILTFDSIYQFNYDSLISAGLSPSEALAGMDSKNAIPLNYRDICVTKYIKNLLMINPVTGKYINYEEKNNYYRMLYGLPDYEDTQFIYNTEYSDISQVTPIHALSSQEIYILESRGYIDKLIATNPSKKYLKYMTDKCIDPYVARSAERYAILWMNASEYANLVADFKSVYNDCRYTIIRVYYTEAFMKDSAHYEGFLAMCVLFMTVQLMHYKYLDVDITRDFYDLDSIKYIYDSYSVPFYSSIPLEYHTKIVKNINRLLSYKGSTRVFFDLFELFDYGGMDVYEYYLLRTHKFDENGKPIFIKKVDGTYDYSSMYDIKFAKVRLYDNPPMEISNPENHIDYEAMTTLDPYWVSDEELLTKLYSSDFNYLETKYVGIQTLFDMTKIMYESAYFFKLLSDNRTIVSELSLYISTVPKYVNLFTLLIYTCALVCKKYGYQGNISSSLPAVSKIMGFDFKVDLTAVRASILSDPNIKNDTTLLNLIRSMNVNSLASINSTFGKISDLRKLLITRKYEAKTKEAFYSYYNIERTLLTADFIESVYKKSDGTTASSFSDLLSDLDSELFVRLISAELDVNYEIDVILAAMLQSFSNLEYIGYADGNDVSSIIEHLFKVLNFFKSAKSELTGYNIVYTLSARGSNMIKFLDGMKIGTEKGFYDDNLKYLSDLLNVGINTYQLKTQLELSLNGEDKIVNYTRISLLEDQIRTFDDMLTLISSKIYFDAHESGINVYDIIKVASFKNILKSVVSFKDTNTLIWTKVDFEGHSTLIKEYFESMNDAIYKITENWSISDTDLSGICDSVALCTQIVISKLQNKTNGRILSREDIMMSENYSTLLTTDEIKTISDSLMYSVESIRKPDVLNIVSDMISKIVSSSNIINDKAATRFVDIIPSSILQSNINNSTKMSDEITLISEAIIPS